MTTIEEVIERLARVECKRSTTDIVFQRREYSGRETFLTTFELGQVQKLGARVVVELREVSKVRV